jgi:hypothetical protein
MSAIDGGPTNEPFLKLVQGAGPMQDEPRFAQLAGSLASNRKLNVP